jgi:CRISPR-associated Csx14 family protein
VDEVIVCGISLERDNGSYETTAQDWLQKGDFEPARELADLPGRECILIAPLGESPMVVTQAYMLLQQKDGVNLKINRVVLPYLADNGLVRAGAGILQQVFERRQVPVDPQPIELDDLRSEADNDIYLRALCDLIEKLKQKHPESDIALLIAGGRKGMSALGLLAAQLTGISYVYHTLIRDFAYERQVIDECSVANLQSSNSREREIKLFPPNITEGAIVFPIPVIHLVQD